MLATFPAPVLAVTADAVRDLDGRDALSGLWTLFTKCKESLQDGRRLENISWRLWYRELALAQPQTYHPLTPDSLPHSPSDAKSRSFFPPQTDTSAVEKGHKVSSRVYSSPFPYQAPSPALIVDQLAEARSVGSPQRSLQSSNFNRIDLSSSVGRIIVEMLPHSAIIPEKPRSPGPRTLNTSGESIHATHRSQPQLHPPPRSGVPSQPQSIIPSHPQQEQLQVQVQVPLVQFPSTPPSGDTSFPRVVVVNPTPHPTPPATPIINHNPTQAGMEKQTSSHLLPPLPPPALRALTHHGAPQLPALPKEPSPPPRPRQADETLKPTDRRFFLKQSPDGESPEHDGSTEGKSSECFEVSSGGSNHIKAEAGARSASKTGKGKESSRNGPARPATKRMHSTRYVAPAMQRRTSAAECKHRATFNIGSMSSNGSKGVVSTTTTTASRGAPTKAVTKASATTAAKASKAMAPSLTKAPQRRLELACTSSDYETTDTDDDDWASEELDAEDSAKQKEEIRLREAAMEAQRQREMFAKVPKRSYSNLGRTQSGLLSQLMNPGVLQPNNSSKASWSTHDVAGVTGLPRVGSGVFPGKLQTSKSSAALPKAAQVTAQAPVSNGVINGKSHGISASGYRPKGRPQEQDMEDESDSDGENDKIQVSRSIAQQKLAALAGRRGSDRSMHTQTQPCQGEMTAPRPPLTSVATAPIALGHAYPYNLPAPAPPMTPRTTRRQMLSTELSESLRRNLLWERQVSNVNLVAGARRPNGGVLGGLRPLTNTSVETSQSEENGREGDERRRRAMARNRSWADDYHYAGW